MKRPSPRAVALAAALAIGAGGGTLIAVALTSPDSDSTTLAAVPPSSTEPPASSSSSLQGSSSTGVSSTTRTTTPPTTLVAPSPSVAPRPENRDPAAVTRSFITGYLSWNWSDQPAPASAVRQRVRPWVTDAFDAGLAQSSSAASITATRIAAHEVNTVTIASLDQIAPATTETELLSLVTVNITKDGAAPSKRSVYIQAKLVLVDGNWYVNELVR